MVIVSEATTVGLKAAKRIIDLVKELKIHTKKNLLLLNRYDRQIEKERIINFGLDCIGNIPIDTQIEKISLNGNSLMDLKEDALSLNALRRFGDKIWQHS